MKIRFLITYKHWISFFRFVGFENPDTFFSRCDRISMVYDILIRTRYEMTENYQTHLDSKFRFGIERLVKNGAYLSAYPLHEVIPSPLFYFV